MTAATGSGRSGRELPGERASTPPTTLQRSATDVDCRRPTYCGCSRGTTRGSATVGSRKGWQSPLGRQDGHGTGAARGCPASAPRWCWSTAPGWTTDRQPEVEGARTVTIGERTLTGPRGGLPHGGQLVDRRLEPEEAGAL